MKYLFLLFPIISFSQQLNHDKYDVINNCDLILKRESYINCYDKEKKGPKYLIYNSADYFKSQEILKKDFKLSEDEEINKEERTNIIDYSKNKIYYPIKLISTYSASNSLKGKEDSYLISNTVPMNEEVFNLWKKIDKLEEIYIKKYKQLNIYSGTVYSDKYFGNKIYIPRLYYKVFFAPNSNKLIVFMIYNKDKQEQDIYKHQITLNELEEITNLKFYNKIEEDRLNKLRFKKDIF
jgi:hypothetical protein